MLVNIKLIATIIIVHFSVQGQNLALHKQTYTSSNESNSFSASNAVDGNVSTRWSSQFVEPSWIYIDLGNDVEINKVILRWEDAYAKKYENAVRQHLSEKWRLKTENEVKGLSNLIDGWTFELSANHDNFEILFFKREHCSYSKK